jgi:uncharacterized protein YjbI with pentapeptide repeats
MNVAENIRQREAEGVDLAGVFIRRTDLSGANLERADLRGADCSYVNFRGANFRGAKLTGAILRGADLTGAHNLTRAQLAEAVIDEKTILPDTFDE